MATSRVNRKWILRIFLYLVCLQIIPGGVSASAEEAPGAGDTLVPPGKVSGVVLNSKTEEPVSGAFVAIDRSGDAGGTNLERFRAEGVYATTETDAAGGFILEGVALLDDHPFYVTCPGFVRHEERIALSTDEPDLEIQVELKPGATLSVNIMDAEGEPFQGKMAVRLEADDGRVFLPLREDWPAYFHQVKYTNENGKVTFGELDTGIFTVEALQIGPTGMVYHGSASGIEIKAGGAKEVSIQPVDYQNGLTFDIAPVPEDASRTKSLFVITRRPGLLLWESRTILHPEDERLGRIMSNALVVSPIEPGEAYVVRNLPPGTYSVFVMTLRGAVILRAVGVEVSPEQGQIFRVPWVEPVAPVGRIQYYNLNRRLALTERELTVQDLCNRLTQETSARPQFVADASIQDEKVFFPINHGLIWDFLETLYLERGWRVEEGGNQLLVLRPPAPDAR